MTSNLYLFIIVRTILDLFNIMIIVTLLCYSHIADFQYFVECVWLNLTLLQIPKTFWSKCQFHVTCRF